MNEQFKSILAKAHLQIAEEKGMPLNTTELADRVATLLVVECSNIADQCIEDEWFDIGNAIKQHFGVK